MGPCPFRHGYLGWTVARRASGSSFNGAMPFQAWIPGGQDYAVSVDYDASMGPCPFRHGYKISPWACPRNGCMLQWGHALSGMDTRSISRISSTQRCFNGAMPFQAWIPASRLYPHLLAFVASMGPCPFRHGYQGLMGEVSSAAYCFNGAMPFQAWIQHSMRDFTPLSHAYSHFCSSTHYPTFFCC